MTGAGINTKPHLAYVPALDGVRAVAVGLVMAYHFGLAAFPGGFLGVDLFFVLSGFLITTLLMREHAEHGRIDLPRFWLRRARRLLPALFLLIAAIAVWAANSSPFERDGLRADILSSLAYVTNWRFIAAGQSYFQEFATPSPVRHLWSLAIEEQFYVLWPLIAMGALSLRVRMNQGGRLAVAALIVATVASAAALAWSFDQLDPSMAYFATHTRAHELLIGALGAVFIDRAGFHSAVRRAAGPVTLGALAVIVLFALLLADSSAVYYRGGSVVFSLAAVALVVGLTVGDARGQMTFAYGVLSTPPIPAIGMISYGLYLWHWPTVIWLTPESTGFDGVLLACLRVAATVLIATASFLVVERPIRRGSLGRVRLGVRAVASGAIIGAVVLSALTVANTRGGRPIPEFVSNNREVLVSEVPQPRGAVGLIGDSIAMSLYPGVAYQAAATGRLTVAATFPGCPVGDAVRVDQDGAAFGFANNCPAAALKGQNRLVREFDPEIIFWLSARERFDIHAGDAILQAGSPEWEDVAFRDWDSVLERLTAGGAEVVVVLPFHRTGDDPRHCAGEAALSSEECTQPNLSTNALREEYMRWARRHPGEVTVVNPDPVFCPQSPCEPALEGVTLRVDRIHFSPEGALTAADALFGLVPPEVWR